MDDWEEVLQKFKERIQCCGTQLLNTPGKVVLVKSMLSSLSGYGMRSTHPKENNPSNW